jgi:cobalamin biosynthesis protein CbiD
MAAIVSSGGGPASPCLAAGGLSGESSTGACAAGAALSAFNLLKLGHERADLRLERGDPHAKLALAGGRVARGSAGAGVLRRHGAGV